jgi:Flp pilus assembly protein TadG
MMQRFRKIFRPFRRDERGLASVEFALFLPVYLGLFSWAAELGIVMIKSVVLDHALDVSMRELRLGLVTDPTQDKLKEAICSRASILGRCQDQLMIELQPISTTTWAMPTTPVTCVNNDEEIQPVVSFDPGRQQELMIVRACIIIPVLFPSMNFGRQLFTDSSGGIGIASVSSFVNEPS